MTHPKAPGSGQSGEHSDWLESDPQGEGLADDLLLGDLEPEGGWRDFDEQGRRIPCKAGRPKPETSGRPGPPPPGVGDISKFISNGSDIQSFKLEQVTMTKDSVEPKSQPEEPRRVPPGVGDYSKFVSDGSDIAVE